MISAHIQYCWDEKYLTLSFSQQALERSALLPQENYRQAHPVSVMHTVNVVTDIQICVYSTYGKSHFNNLNLRQKSGLRM